MSRLSTGPFALSGDPWNPGPRTRADLWIAAGLGLFFFVLYALTRSCGPDDWDSVQFIFALDGFNLRLHRPHPPGYPLYVALGHVARWLTGAENHGALTLVSAAGGGLLVGVLFLWTRTMMAGSWAVLGTMAAGFSPALWMSSNKAMTDVPASALLLGVVVLAMEACLRRRPAFLVLAAACAAVAGGIRPQNTFVLVLILAMAGVGGRVGWRWGLAASGVWVLGNLAWLLPTMAIQAEAGGGNFWTAYWQSTGSQFRWRFDQPTVYAWAALKTDPLLIQRMFLHFGSWIGVGVGNVLHPAGWILLPLVLGGLAGFWKTYFGAKPEPMRRVMAFSFFWMVPYVLMIFVFLPANVRYYVPVMGPLAVLAVAGWTAWVPKLRDRVRWAAVAIPVLLFIATAPLAWENCHEQPPPVRALEWLKAEIPAEEQTSTLFVFGQTARHFEYLQPGFPGMGLASLSRPGRPEAVAREYRRIYTDAVDLPARIGRPDWVLTEVATFHRSLVIHPKHDRVSIYRVDGWEPAGP